jgi:hypothetical protein
VHVVEIACIDCFTIPNHQEQACFDNQPVLADVFWHDCVLLLSLKDIFSPARRHSRFENDQTTENNPCQCLKVQTTNHILTECRLSFQQRGKVQQEIQQILKEETEITVKKLFRNKSSIKPESKRSCNFKNKIYSTNKGQNKKSENNSSTSPKQIVVRKWSGFIWSNQIESIMENIFSCIEPLPSAQNP